MTTPIAGKSDAGAGPRTSKFHVATPAARKDVDLDALEKFASAAEAKPSALPVPAAQPEPNPVPSSAPAVKNKTAERTCGFPIRLKPQQFDRIEEVYMKSTYKSKQDFGETLLMDAVENLARQLGI